MVIICAVAAGVGIFLVLAILRMLLGIALPPVLTFFYVICFILAFFTPREFLSVAFDSGGVTTGPMTVPFIMALGVGIASIPFRPPCGGRLLWPDCDVLGWADPGGFAPGDLL